MGEQSAEHKRLQSDLLTSLRTRDEMLRERAGLQRRLEEHRSSADSLAEQLGRYKIIEQRLFDEKQSYQSQLEALKEEKTKLAKVND